MMTTMTGKSAGKNGMTTTMTTTAGSGGTFIATAGMATTVRAIARTMRRAITGTMTSRGTTTTRKDGASTGIMSPHRGTTIMMGVSTTITSTVEGSKSDQCACSGKRVRGPSAAYERSLLWQRAFLYAFQARLAKSRSRRARRHLRRSSVSRSPDACFINTNGRHTDFTLRGKPSLGAVKRMRTGSSAGRLQASAHQ